MSSIPRCWLLVLALFAVLTPGAWAERVDVFSAFPMRDLAAFVSGQYGCILNCEMPLELNEDGNPAPFLRGEPDRWVSLQFEDSGDDNELMGGSPSGFVQALNAFLENESSILDENHRYRLDTISDNVHTIRPVLLDPEYAENPDISPLDMRVTLDSRNASEILDEIDEQLNHRMKSCINIEYSPVKYLCDWIVYMGPRENVTVREVLNGIVQARMENILLGFSYENNKKAFMEGHRFTRSSINLLRWELLCITSPRDKFEDVLWTLNLKEVQISRTSANYFYVSATRPFLTGLQMLQSRYNIPYGCEEPECKEDCELMGSFPRGGTLMFKYSPAADSTEMAAAFNASCHIPGADTPRYGMATVNGRYVFVPAWINSSSCMDTVPAAPIVTQPIALDKNAQSIEEHFAHICNQLNTCFAERGESDAVSAGRVPPGISVDTAALTSLLGGDIQTPRPATEVISAVLDASGLAASWQLIYDYAAKEYVLEVGSAEDELTDVHDEELARQEDISRNESNPVTCWPDWKEIKRQEKQMLEQYKQQRLKRQFEKNEKQ